MRWRRMCDKRGRGLVGIDGDVGSIVNWMIFSLYWWCIHDRDFQRMNLRGSLSLPVVPLFLYLSFRGLRRWAQELMNFGKSK